MALSPASTTAVSASARGVEKTPWWSRMSTISSLGGCEPSTRCRRSACSATRAKLSTEGVADPRRTIAPVAAARQLRDGARVVGRLALLLVRGVVFLVDDDKPEVGERREHRRARADHDAHLAARHGGVGEQPLPRREPGVQYRDLLAGEAPLDARHGLAGQADLGHEEQDRAAGVQRRLRRLEVDLGLAAAGDAVQQDLVAGARLAQDAVQRTALLGQQVWGCRRARRSRADGRPARQPGRRSRPPCSGPPGRRRPSPRRRPLPSHPHPDPWRAPPQPRPDGAVPRRRDRWRRAVRAPRAVRRRRGARAPRAAGARAVRASPARGAASGPAR